MSTALLAALGLAAVLMLWMVGAYNRLTAQRSAIGQAWARVAEALDMRAAATPGLAEALAQPLAAEQDALRAWAEATAAGARAAAAMTAQPASAERCAAWTSAESQLASASARVFALLEQQPELARSEAVAPLATAWREGQRRLRFARQVFNDAAEAHDAALAEFPTRLLAPMFGLRPAGRL